MSSQFCSEWRAIPVPSHERLKGAGFTENGRFDGFLAADDFHRFVSDNDRADQRAQICLARGRFAIIEQVSQEFAERSDPFRVNAGRWQH
jgi:hypothetical protein